MDDTCNERQNGVLTTVFEDIVDEERRREIKILKTFDTITCEDIK